MSDTRCEPPEELRGVDGWHWVRNRFGYVAVRRWLCGPYPAWRSGGMPSTPDGAFTAGYRYLAPVATPAEVEALRRERDEARAALKPFADVASLAEAGGEWWALVGIDDVLAARAALAKEAGDADAT
jgi:hypothetical protein